jgi:hypothetical protein
MSYISFKYHVTVIVSLQSSVLHNRWDVMNAGLRSVNAVSRIHFITLINSIQVFEINDEEVRSVLKESMTI